MLDYLNANQHYFSSPKAFFESFAKSMHSGTIGEDGYDPSGLYWLPKRTTTSNNLLYSLTQFSDWMAQNFNVKPLNPWRNARAPSSDNSGTKAFPEDKIHELLREGFKKTNKKNDLSFLESYNWRNIAITILMHRGGIRHCEAYHLWVHDVMPRRSRIGSLRKKCKLSRLDQLAISPKARPVDLQDLQSK